MRRMFAALALFATCVLTAGCQPTMAIYWKSVGTAAITGQQCIDALEAADDGKYKAAKALKSQGDEAGATLLWDQWLPTYKKIKTACDSVLTAAVLAKAAGPSVEAALNRDKDAMAWVSRLIKLGLDAVNALAEIGIKLPGGT